MSSTHMLSCGVAKTGLLDGDMHVMSYNLSKAAGRLLIHVIHGMCCKLTLAAGRLLTHVLQFAACRFRSESGFAQTLTTNR